MKEVRTSISSPQPIYVLTTLVMFYMSIMLLNAVLTNRYVGSKEFFILGGTLTSPLVFILDDIIAEIYGYRVTRWVILSGYLAQTFFCLVCEAIIMSPSPPQGAHNFAYAQVLGVSLLRIDFSGFLAYITANLVNSYILTRWKVFLKGRAFWLRSLGSSFISEAMYSLIAIILMEINSISLDSILKVVCISFFIKIICSALFSVPGNFLVTFLKKYTGMDVYDYPANFTPSKYSMNHRGVVHND